MDDNFIQLINESLSEEETLDITQDIETLRNRVLTMGGLVERLLEKSLNGLFNNDSALSQAAIDGDAAVNQEEIAIDEECMRLLKTFAPDGEDLMFIMSVARTITDIERIGDQSGNIGQVGLRLASAGGMPEKYKRRVRHLGQSVRNNLRDGLNAMARRDGESAFQVVKADKEIDEEYEGILREMLTYMMEDPRNIQACMDIIWVVRALERVGDHVKNIAEHVLYLNVGGEIRHIKMKHHVSYESLLDSIAALKAANDPE